MSEVALNNQNVQSDEENELEIIPKKPKGMSFQTQKKLWGLIFVSPVIIGIIVFFLYPFVMSIWYSFNIVNFGHDGITFTFVGWGNFENAFRVHLTFMQVLAETAINVASSIFIILFFSLFMAVILNGKFKGKTFVRAVFFIPVVLNSEAIATVMGNSLAEGIGAVLGQTGAGALNDIFDLNQFLANAHFPPALTAMLTTMVGRLYEIVTFSGIQIIIFLAAIQSVPKHLYEAAVIEGATKYETFWKITFPMVAPMFLPILVFTVMDSFSQSPLNTLLITQLNTGVLGLHAAMSWVYFGVSMAIVIIYYLIISKGVLAIYEGERKRKPRVL
ncbi:MAG: sugar ABC transporter permease [Erysipelotrichales bacterium]|nr:sugar ABC transporter permease [Erysipelotrichales bacterium]